ncbi:hypothetical protein NDU88_000835 [Pleurodeles waltl]|uniref:Uncharacterized protein n=1 Tax=Pleurodeles waltl TaxID=8319 RepID=A0AAV7SAT1_PLEWA|nr:hypothetical protein NDU88_000835 [Pleurodeles waltl]
MGRRGAGVPKRRLLAQRRSDGEVPRRAAPQESGSWRSSASLQPRRHGDAWGRRRKSAPEFRVADTEEGLRATGRGGSAGRDQEAEEETGEKREEERDAETDHQDEIGRSAESEREGEARKSANPGHQGNEEEEKSEEPHREETEDATACHGPGGSWLDKVRALVKGRKRDQGREGVGGNLPPGYRNTPPEKEREGRNKQTHLRRTKTRAGREEKEKDPKNPEILRDNFSIPQ